MTQGNLRTLSLFSGIGGFEVAGSMLGGFDFTDAVEVNPFRQQILKARFPHLIIHNDVKTYQPDQNFDLVVFGSPCQNLSCAGLQQGIGGDRSILFFDALRIIEKCQSDFVVWENVAGAINNGLRAVLGAFRVAGYQTEAQIVSCAEIGGPHKRERIFVIAYSDRIKHSFGSYLPAPWSRQIRNHIALLTDPSSFRLPDGQHELPRRPRQTCPPQSQQKDIQGEDELSPSLQERTGTLSEFGRHAVSCGKVNTRGTKLSSSSEGVDDGILAFLDRLRTAGYWRNPQFFPRQITAPRYSIPNRRARISALGDSVSPIQAMLPLMRVKYLAAIVS